MRLESLPSCEVVRAYEGGRAWAAERFWQQLTYPVVPGVGGQLCGTEARPAHGRDPVLPGQAAVLVWLGLPEISLAELIGGTGLRKDR